MAKESKLNPPDSFDLIGTENPKGSLKIKYIYSNHHIPLPSGKFYFMIYFPLTFYRILKDVV